MTIGRAVYMRRLQVGLTRHGLAKRTGLSYNTIWRTEKELYEPKQSTLRTIATGLDTTPEELLKNTNSRHGRKKPV